MEFQLSLQTIRTTAAGSLKSMKPDAEGFYRGVPLAVLGVPSRNNIFYEPATVVHAMKNPDSRFYKAITGGGLDGEWGHPDVTGMSDEAALNRISQVSEQLTSHYFNRIYIEKSSCGRFTMVKGDVKAYGPYGQHLTASFADANHDTGFSLRTLTSRPVRRADGVGVKNVLAMITYDAVSLPGWEESSKRGVIGTENLGVLFEDATTKIFETATCVDSKLLCDTIGYEKINCQEVLDILKSDSLNIKFESKTLGVYDSATNTFSGVRRKQSAFHQLAFGGPRG